MNHLEFNPSQAWQYMFGYLESVVYKMFSSCTVRGNCRACLDYLLYGSGCVSLRRFTMNASKRGRRTAFDGR